MDMGSQAITWPPEKPTATIPSSLPADRNLGEIVEGEVIIFAFKIRCVEWCLYHSLFSGVLYDGQKYIPCSNRMKRGKGRDKEVGKDIILYYSVG